MFYMALVGAGLFVMIFVLLDRMKDKPGLSLGEAVLCLVLGLIALIIGLVRI